MKNLQIDFGDIRNICDRSGLDLRVSSHVAQIFLKYSVYSDILYRSEVA